MTTTEVAPEVEAEEAEVEAEGAEEGVEEEEVDTRTMIEGSQTTNILTKLISQIPLVLTQVQVQIILDVLIKAAAT